MLDIKVLASSSAGNAYLVGDGKSRLLLDAGIPIAQISEGCGYRVSELAGCLVTHNHQDHSRAIEDLDRRGVKVFGPIHIAQKGRPVIWLQPNKKISVGTFDVIPFRVDHDIPCFGYQIQSVATGDRLVYVTDAAGMPFKFGDINYWLVEANYSVDILDKRVEEGMDKTRANRVIETHMAIEDLEAYFDELNTSMADAIYLCHLSDDNSDAKDFKRRIRQVTGAMVIVADSVRRR